MTKPSPDAPPRHGLLALVAALGLLAAACGGGRSTAPRTTAPPRRPPRRQPDRFDATSARWRARAARKPLGHARPGRRCHLDHHRLRRRRRLPGQPRSRPRGDRRRQGHDRLVQRAGRHQRSHGRGQLLRRQDHRASPTSWPRRAPRSSCWSASPSPSPRPAEQTRIECGLPAVPGVVSGGALSMAPLMVAPYPSRSTSSTSAPLRPDRPGLPGGGEEGRDHGAHLPRGASTTTSSFARTAPTVGWNFIGLRPAVPDHRRRRLPADTSRSSRTAASRRCSPPTPAPDSEHPRRRRADRLHARSG